MGQMAMTARAAIWTLKPCSLSQPFLQIEIQTFDLQEFKAIMYRRQARNTLERRARQPRTRAWPPGGLAERTTAVMGL